MQKNLLHSGMSGSHSKDTRFASIETDPRFKLPRKKNLRGNVDDRFKQALQSDERFSSKTAIDKYGRKVEKRDISDELKRYYNFDGEEEDALSGEPLAAGSDDDSFKSANEELTTKLTDKRKMMRGEGTDDLSSDSDSDSSMGSEDEDNLSQEMQDEYEQIRQSNATVPQGDVTKRIAAVNMDWDNVTSTDLMSALSSFVPAGGRIVSVQIFPSEYGKKQMQAEELQGPAGELFAEEDTRSKSLNRSIGDVEDDQDYSSSRLRKYQLQRLQYYYAVITCDSEATASSIYDECDGTEYESTANFFDLRYIPDDVDFSADPPRDECFKLPANYQPTNFTTDALQHSRVKLTWDETPKERLRTAQKAFQQSTKDDDFDADVRAYLASDPESDQDEDLVTKYRALLAKDEENASDSEDGVDITFNPVLEGKEAKFEVVGKPGIQVATNDDGDENLTTLERYKLKEKQRRQRRLEKYKIRKAEEADQSKSDAVSKAELELLAMEDDLVDQSRTETRASGDKPKPKKLTKRATKKMKQEELENDFNTSDPRFSALFEDPDYAIDSTLPQFKRTKGMVKIMQERRRRQGSVKDPRTKRPKPSQGDESVQQLAAKLRRKSAR